MEKLSIKTTDTNIPFKIILFCLLLFAFLLRYKGIRFGFPIIVHPDEPTIVNAGMKILKNHTLNPGFFNYPTLFIYMQAVVYSTAFVLGRLFETAFSTEANSDMTYYYWGRFLTIVMSTGTVYLTYRISRLLFNRIAGLISALFISVCFLHVRCSFSITVDSPMTFWVAAAFLSSVWNFKFGPKIKYYAINAILIGLAAGTKYNAVLCVLPMIYVHLYHSSFSVKKIFDKKVIACFFLIPAAFLISTPYAVFDFKAFYEAIRFEAEHYSIGFIGDRGNAHSFGFYLESLYSGFGPVFLAMSLLGLLRIFRKNIHLAILLICFPLCYYLFVGRFVARAHRNIVVLVPFLSLTAGYGAYFLLDFCKLKIKPVFFARLAMAVVVAVAGFGCYEQFDRSWSYLKVQTLPDTRWISLQWIDKNIPTEASIAREHYTPPLDANKFDVEYLGWFGLIEHDISQYDIVIASDGDWGRFFKKPELFAEQVAKYSKIFSEYKLIREFKPDETDCSGPVIRIYQSPQSTISIETDN